MAITISARCPACQSAIRFDETPELGDFLVCEECDAELEVVQLKPLKLSWVDEEEYDDDEDFDYDELEYADFDDEDFDYDDDDDDDFDNDDD